MAKKAKIYGTASQQAYDLVPWDLKEPDFLKEVNMMEEFNTNRTQVYSNAQVKGIPHIFFTTPMMNMSKENCDRNSSLLWISKSQPNVLSALSYGSGSTSDKFFTTSPFIKLLSNTALSFEPKDSVSKTKEVGETFYGYKLTLPSADVDSLVGDEISIKYRDIAGLPVLNLHKAWYDYHNGVRRGYIVPNRQAITNHYIDYTSSIFYFLTDMDGQTIRYWCKLTGVAPLNVPYSAFSSDWQNRDIIEYSIQYVYSFKEDMDPDIFLDFNKLVFGKDLEMKYTEPGESYLNSATPTSVIPGLENMDSYQSMESIRKLPTAHEASGKKMPQIVVAKDRTSEKPIFKLVYTNK